MAQVLPGFIVGFREGLEAFLIISFVLEYLDKLGKTEFQGSVRKGLITGFGVSVLFGAVLWIINSTIGKGSDVIEELWSAAASFIAVLLITYFIYWMIRHGRSFAKDMKNSVDLNLSAKGLFLLSTVAVAREGTEIALFAFAAEDKTVYLTGNLAGLLAAAILSFLIYKSLVSINIGLIFRMTLLYLVLQAAYLFGNVYHELFSVLKTLEFIPADSSIFTTLYDFSGTILDRKRGWLGIALNVIIGWDSRPEIFRAVLHILYAGVLGSIWAKANYGNNVQSADRRR